LIREQFQIQRGFPNIFVVYRVSYTRGVKNKSSGNKKSTNESSFKYREFKNRREVIVAGTKQLQ
jgi:hypothetical protein